MRREHPAERLPRREVVQGALQLGADRAEGAACEHAAQVVRGLHRVRHAQDRPLVLRIRRKGSLPQREQTPVTHLRWEGAREVARAWEVKGCRAGRCRGGAHRHDGSLAEALAVLEPEAKEADKQLTQPHAGGWSTTGYRLTRPRAEGFSCAEREG